MSNKLFPSTILSMVSKAKMLAISFAPQGSSALTMANVPSAAGVKSVVRNSARSTLLSIYKINFAKS